MASKALLLLALLASAAVLAAADQQHAHGNFKGKVATNDNAGVNDDHHGGGGGGYNNCRYRCCYYGRHGWCERCCATPDEVPQPQLNN